MTIDATSALRALVRDSKNPTAFLDGVPAPTRAVRSPFDLEEVFCEAEKPAGRFRIGGETEKFLVDQASLRPIGYDGPRSILRVLELLGERCGWVAAAEMDGGPIISMRRGAASVTLEPGGQLELSGAPLADMHALHLELTNHLLELRPILEELGLLALSIGFHPTAQRNELPWVPKQRYAIMREYLPTRGERTLDMMQRTATVQFNFDYSSQSDAMRKLSVLLRCSPLIQVMTANSPFIAGRVSFRRSERRDVWKRFDPARSGLLPALWRGKPLAYDDYVQWALGAGMYFFQREGRIIRNTGQSFADFLRNGFAGERATLADWRRHLSTLYPDVRLRHTLEFRACDALPAELASAVGALLTGIVYDEFSLGLADDLLQGFSALALQLPDPEPTLGTRLGDTTWRELAEKLLELGRAGLQRRRRLDAMGQDESVYLRPLQRLVERGQSPADGLRAGSRPGERITAADLAAVIC